MATTKLDLSLASLPAVLGLLFAVATPAGDAGRATAELRDAVLRSARGANTAYQAQSGSFYCACILGSDQGVACDCTNLANGTDCVLCSGLSSLSGVATPPGESGSFIQPAGSSGDCSGMTWWDGQCAGGACIRVLNQNLPCYLTYPLFDYEST